MRDVRITVLKVTLDEELCKKYASPGIEPCHKHYVGQVMIAKGGAKPAELCGGAWTPCEKYVFALSQGIDEFGFKNWMGVPKTVVTCCLDGLRPITLLIEAIDE